MKTIIRFIRINQQTLGITLLVLLIGSSSCKKEDDTNMNGKISYSGTFAKSSDAVVTSATGTVTATYDPATMVLSYQLTWSGLGSNAVNMHFHDNGPVIAEITGFANSTSGTISGTVTLSTSQSADLGAGKIYAQIHTVNIPAGEIKATLSKSSSSYDSTGGGYGY
jgi:hypothetical protein